MIGRAIVGLSIMLAGVMPAFAQGFSDRELVSLAKSGNLQGACAYGQRWTAAQPTNGLAWYDYGHVAVMAGDYNAAITALTKATEFVPNQAKPWNDLADAYEKKNQDQDAVLVLKTGITRAKCDSHDWYVFGNAFKALTKFNEAITCYDKALASSPNYAAAMNNKAICLTATNDQPGALKLFERAVQLGDSDSISNAKLLRSYMYDKGPTQFASTPQQGMGWAKRYNDFLSGH